MTEHRYSREEVDAILGRAIEREHGRGDLSHEDLVAAAREVGISADAIDAAAMEVLSEQRKKNELVEVRHQQWRGFFRHLVRYLLVNGMLATLNVLTSHFPWALFPATAWGIGLFFHLMAVVSPNPQRLQRRLERQRERERRRQTRRLLRENASQYASQLEHDVGAGISALLQAAAERIAVNPNASKGAAERRRVVDATGAEMGSETDGTTGTNAPRDPSRSRGGMPQR